MGQKGPRSAASPGTGQVSNPFLGRLLYVEDNAQIAEITCLMLEDTGLDIVQASSAEEALRLVDTQESPFDIVLTDVVMPGLSGVQLARRLNQRWPNLPIVLVSGFSEELTMGYGAQYELLRKPFTRGALFDCLQRHLDGSIYQHA
ncbi:response regulator [Rhizorhabdus histidinilytica]|uniref:Response regulator receiver domain-containing protein n=1 Tax=Rhizorhabdus histidinilytica TaxID=439228 RepID=A0A1T5BY62_9SPHN|nr:response regulator [Rhizorhabdus histidinilytica]SKB52106.1 Response regulator receiver domain-containing protein [Rhizorhabdus histidinilytica]